MRAPQSPNQNHLLAALPTAEFERLVPHLEPVEMLLGDVLYESGGLPGLPLAVVGTGVRMPPDQLAVAPLQPAPLIVPPEAPPAVVVPPAAPPPVYVPPARPRRPDRN